MATQTTKIIDVTRTFVPTDPNAFPENYSATNREDYPEAKKPVMCYEGHNFLPTPYGYKSFFGITSKFEADSLESRADELFIVQTNTFENILVALAEDGIWTKAGDAAGAWTHAITLEVPDEGTHLDWTYCLIGNTLFCYRATEPEYYSYSTLNVYFTPGQLPSGVTGLGVTESVGTGSLPAGNYYYRVAYFAANGELSLPTAAVLEATALDSANTIAWDTLPAAVNGYRLYVTNSLGVTKYVDVAQDPTPTFTHEDLADIPNEVTLPDQSPIIKHDAYEFFAVVPTFLNMAGQQGIFKAGSRLGFWDSENSTSWSSIDDFAEFTPSVTTLAGGAVFNEVIGRITMILSSADGFVIYATKSIVHIGRNLQSTFNWNPTVVAKGTGIAFKRQCCSSSPDTTQFAYTTTGLMQIEGTKGEYIVPEITDYLKDSKEPVYLKILEGRFLFLEVLDSNYINGLVEFEEVYVPGIDYEFDFEEVEDYLEGRTEGQVDAIEQARIDLGLPERGNGQEFNAKHLAFKSDVRIVTPLEDGLPVFTALTHPTNQGQKYLGTAPEEAVTPVDDPYEITTELVDIGGGTMQCLVTNPGIIPYGSLEAPKEVIAGIDMEPTEDLSGVVPFTSIDGLFAIQNQIWQERDTDVLAMIAYVGTREQEGRLAPYPNSPSGEFGTAGFMTTYDKDVSQPGWEAHAGNHVNVFYGPPPTPYDEPLFTVDSGWSVPTVTFENHRFTLKRTRTQITTMYYLIEFFKEFFFQVNQTNFCTDPEGIDNYRLDDVSFRVSHYSGNGSTIGLPDNPVQEAYVELEGFEYIDINGDTQFIDIDAIDFSLVETPDIVDEEYVLPDIPPLSFPPSSFLLQTGSIGPIYPTIPGAYVYDMQLKKWGKIKQDYKLLLDFAPINNSSGSVVTNDVFGITGGILQTDGKIALFDKFPESSYLKYGKIGYSREGFTSLQEVHAKFRDVSDGYLQIETSIDGVNVDSSLTTFTSFTVGRKASCFPNISGRWHTISVGGVWDLKDLQYRGFAFGKR